MTIPDDTAAEAVGQYIATTIPARFDADVSQTIIHLEEAESILRATRAIPFVPRTGASAE